MGLGPPVSLQGWCHNPAAPLSTTLLLQVLSAWERKAQASERVRITQYLIPLLPQLLAKVRGSGDWLWYVGSLWGQLSRGHWL